MPVERHRSADACMKFHFGLHRTSRENVGGGLAVRCDSTDLRKEIRLVADGMCQILIPEWAMERQGAERTIGVLLRAGDPCCIVHHHAQRATRGKF